MTAAESAMAAQHQRHGATRERFAAAARSLGVDLDEVALVRLERFLEELERWNARSNLVGEHDRRSLIDRHIVDSLAAAPLLRGLGTELHVADLGSGAGLPGIPLAIAAQPREMVLVEPRRKRASFLRAIRRLLDPLPLSIFEGCAEDLEPSAGGGFDAVVSRAALSDDALLAAARPLLRDRGLLIAYRGSAAALAGSPALANPRGYGPATVQCYGLPDAPRSFTLVVRERRVSRETPS